MLYYKKVIKTHDRHMSLATMVTLHESYKSGKYDNVTFKYKYQLNNSI